MLDRREYASNEGSRGETASNGADNSRALQAYENHETGVALPLPDDGTNYAELFARLQKLIDNATQTIRDLRRENADLHGRVSQLDSYINMRAEAISNEEELQKSASRLEELLTMQAMAAAKELRTPPPAAPIPLRVFEPVPAPAPPAPPPMIVSVEPASVSMNGHASLRDTVSFAAPPVSLPLVEPVMPTFTQPAPPAPPAPLRQESAIHFTPTTPTISERTSEHTVVTLPVVPLMPVPEPVAAPEVPEAPEMVFEAPMPPLQPVSPVVAAPVVAAPVVQVAPVAPVAPVAETVRAFTPSPSPVRRAASAPMSGNEKMAGTYTLVVYPFTRFSDLGQFQSVLQEVVGVHDVQVRRFAQGTLEMRLGYDGTIPLPQALHNLSIGIEDVEEEEPYRLRVRLDLNHGS